MKKSHKGKEKESLQYYILAVNCLALSKQSQYKNKSLLKQALKHLFQSLRLNSQHALSYTQIGFILLLHDNRIQARQFLEKALSFDPQQELALMYLDKLETNSSDKKITSAVEKNSPLMEKTIAPFPDKPQSPEKVFNEAGVSQNPLQKNRPHRLKKAKKRTNVNSRAASLPRTQPVTPSTSSFSVISFESSTPKPPLEESEPQAVEPELGVD